jgi:hypothetical protein
VSSLRQRFVSRERASLSSASPFANRLYDSILERTRSQARASERRTTTALCLPAGSVAAIAFGAPELEAPVRRLEVHRKLFVKRCHLVAELENLVVEETLAVAHVLVLLRPLDGLAAVGARQVPGLGKRDAHRE